MFTSPDEAVDGRRSLELFHSVLGGKVIELKGYEHYTYEDMCKREFPELLQEVLDE